MDSNSTARSSSHRSCHTPPDDPTWQTYQEELLAMGLHGYFGKPVKPEKVRCVEVSPGQTMLVIDE